MTSPEQEQDKWATIHVARIVGSQFCVTAEDGDLVSPLIRRQLDLKGKVVIDFEGVRICASPFLNAVVGQAFMDLKSLSSFHSSVRWINASATTERLLRDVIVNAEQFYSAPAETNRPAKQDQ